MIYLVNNTKERKTWKEFTTTFGAIFLAEEGLAGLRVVFCSLSLVCNRFICSFNLSLRLNCFPQSAQRNSRWSECLKQENKFTSQEY